MHMYSKPGHPLCSSAFHYLIHRAYPEVPEHHFRHHLRPSAPCVMLSGLRQTTFPLLPTETQDFL